MIRNYLIVALRHLYRHKLFTLVNMLCLAVGISFALLISNYVLHENSVNATLRNVERQYLIKSNWSVSNMGLPVTTIAPLAKALKEEYPSLVANYFRYNPVTNVVSAGEQHFRENIAICDTSLVSMYGFRLLHGNPSNAFPSNTSALITEKLARKLFNTNDAVGKTVSVTTTTNGNQDYVVSGVLEEMPRNSVNSLVDEKGYDVFVPFEGNRFFANSSYVDDWSNMYLVGMIELQPGVGPEDLKKPVKDLLATRLPANLRGVLDIELAGLADLYQRDNNGAVHQMIRTLSLIALFILLMAIINFVNISIGTSAYRLKEIGLRKVFGGAKKQLVLQYLSEALLLQTIAGFVALALYEMAIPLFTQVLEVPFPHVWEFQWMQVIFLLVLVPVLGLVAGAYPAFVLSSSRLVNAVKGRIDSSNGGLTLRRVLLTIQFTLAIFVFIGTLNISRQVNFFFNKDLGYEREQLLVISAFPKQWDSSGVLRIQSIRDGLLRLSFVKEASVSFEVPDRLPPNTTDLLPVGTSGGRPVVVPTIVSDANFAETFGLRLIEGSFLSDHPSRAEMSAGNASEIVINESAARLLNASVGDNISMPTGFAFGVRGIVKDFNLSSFQQAIGPVAFIPVTLANQYRYITLKLKTADAGKAIAEVKTGWQALSPNSPFEYNFMDERFEALYRGELKLKKAADLATGLNLFIVLMGIFGIVAFTLARRTREIAVRKVLGANLGNIVTLFVRDYAWLLVIANVIAWPLGYLATDRWLHNYAYRMDQDLFTYLTVAIVVWLITFGFITVQCLRAGMSNPVKNLRAD